MAPELECVCIRCAQPKLDLFDPCPACRFTPETHEEYARTLILSDNYVIFGTDRTRPPDQLREARAALKAGTYRFDLLEVSGVTAFFEWQDRYFRTLSKGNARKEVLFYFAPLIAGLLALFAHAACRRHHYALSAILALASVPGWIKFVVRLSMAKAAYQGEGPDELDHWLNEPRAVETNAAIAPIDDARLPPEAATLFQRYGRIRIRHTDVELSGQHVAPVAGKPDLLRIGVWERGDVLIHRRTGEIREVEGRSVRAKFRGIGVYITSICGDDFRHLASNQPPG